MAIASPKARSRLRKPLGWTLVIAAVAAGLVQLNHKLDIDDFIYAQWKEQVTPAATKRQSVWLNQYQLQRQGRIRSIDNLSGITYNPATNSLWVITNNPQQLLELDADWLITRRIELDNFEDTEALAYAGHQRMIIADERDQSIVVAAIDSTTNRLDKEQLKRITLDTHGGENTGFEGIAVDIENQLIYVVRERNPMTLITVKGLLGDKQGLELRSGHGADVTDIYLDDLSGLHFDSGSGNLLVLSDESRAVAEITPAGTKVSYLDLIAGFHGLGADVPQAEGVAIGPAGDLFVVSEPNLIFQFQAASP